jgi:tetratricopeptide (TPR) repeat protein
MNTEHQSQIEKDLRARETNDPLEIWQNDDPVGWEEAVFEIIAEILEERLGYVPPQSVKTQVSPLLENANEYLEKNEFQKAFSACEHALQIQPDSAAAFNCRGEIFDEMGQLYDAITNYRKAVEIDPDLKDAWENLFGVESELEDLFEESLAKEHLDLALDLAYSDETNKAMEECESARLLIPDLACAYNYLGLIYQTLGQLEQAIESYQRAVQLNPRFSAGYENLANAKECWQEEQYRLFSIAEPDESQEPTIELDESQIQESTEPLPQWLYMDKSSYILMGWPGHRTRQGRSGYDQLDSEFEFAHMQGVMIRLLLARKFRTHNPIYLVLMTIVGLLYFLFGISPVIFGNLPGIFLGLLFSPYSITGAMLLVNVFLSLKPDISGEYDEKEYTFF